MRKGMVPRHLFVLTSSLLLAVLGVPLRAQQPVPVIPVEEIQPGQEGYGLSVFSGNAPERFDVEVVGLMRNVAPEVSYILARLTGQGLEESGVVAGMSGSPVFLDGRLAGAVAFTWSFSREAIAGITPIEAMRQLSTLEAEDVSPAASVVELHELLATDLPPDLLERHLASLRPRLSGNASHNLQWSTIGFPEQTQSLLSRALGPVTPAGRASGDLASDLVPGSAVAGVLVDGDLELAVTGTVTDRTGDEILALGHSFLGLGPVQLPMAGAEVLTVVSNQAVSFKLTNIGPILGAFDQDRLAGMRGRLGLEAPTIPLTVKVRGLQERDYHMRVADLPQMSPTLVAIAVLGALDAASYSAGATGADLLARFQLHGYPDLIIRQNFDGNAATLNAALYLFALSAFVVQNSLEEVGVEAIEVQVVQSAAPKTATLVGAHAERTQVRPGDRIGLNLDLVAYRGEAFRHSLEIEVPADIPAGRYFLFVGDGTSIDATRLLIEPAEPVNFRQALELLSSFHPRQELVVLGVFGGPGLVVGGQVMPRLPGSVRSIWDAASSLSATKLGLAVAQEHVEQMRTPVSGLVRIDLEVLRREPFSEKPAGTTGPGDGSAPTLPPAGSGVAEAGGTGREKPE